MNAIIFASMLISGPADCYPIAQIVEQSKVLRDAGATPADTLQIVRRAFLAVPDYTIQHQVVLAHGSGFASVTPAAMYQISLSACLNAVSSNPGVN